MIASRIAWQSLPLSLVLSAALTAADPGSVCVTFDGIPQQPATTALIQNLFGGLRWLDPGDKSPLQDRNQVGNGVLRIVFPPGLYGPATTMATDGSGINFHIGLQSRKAYDLSMRLLFEPGFDFGRTTSTQEGKLIGLGGGSLPSGGTRPDGTGFTCRFIWRENGLNNGTARLKLYVYYLGQSLRTPGSAWGDTIDLGLNLTPGQWYALQMKIAIDANGDGRVDTYANGALTPAQPALCNGKKWMKAGLGIDTLMVETFYGGGDSSYAPNVQSALLMDDITVAPPRGMNTAPVKDH
jgi:hypothetical protein